ncbi:MAG: Flp family type IVb pilin [Johnsonella sp.]|nr:Flp family type IVb pilin [Johnsonella sp.]
MKYTEKERSDIVMRKFLNNIMAEESGQGLVEYALILSIIAVGLIAALRALHGRIETVFTNTTF